MAEKDPQAAEEIFQKAVELPADERDRFLSRLCAGDSDLRSRVEDRLRRHVEAEFDRRTSTLAESDAPTPHTRGQIGAYRLIEGLGEGGMGEVWLAEQAEPVRRKVALKIIKRGMDTQQVVARFEAERQALALMDHPTIAKIFDAGATPEGRPYFVMEHVPGVPITEYCDGHKLTNRERLDLFIQVCEGVQHAHQKAVIHRDLKPSNVLVMVRDRKPVPKIIDFGVAKATAQRLTEKTLHTQVGMLVGTPSYMSPEQAQLTGEDIDTRTDVYALGVMLYELLVGALPFDPKELRRAGYEAMVRKICEEEPPKPSTRISALGERSTRLAARRGTEPPALRRALSGDLDWITMKALEKDRTRRYSSPLDLAADLERYRTDRPVLASPPSTAYQVRKFVRRHTAGVAAAGVGLVIIIAFAVMMTVQAGRIAAERDRANAEAERASQEAMAKGQVSEFLKDLFEVSDPSEARGNSITARELLDRGAERIEETLADEPLIQAELMGTMGVVYTNLGLYEEAGELLEQRLAVNRQSFGNDHLDTAESARDLAVLYKKLGRFGEAEQLSVEALETHRLLLGADHPQALASANGLAVLYKKQGRYAEAESLYVSVLKATRDVLGNEHVRTIVSMNNLGVLYKDLGRYAEAEPLLLEAMETNHRLFDASAPRALALAVNLATLYDRMGRQAEAQPLYLEALDAHRRIYGDDHPYTRMTVFNLAGSYVSVGDYERAEPLYVEDLATNRRIRGNEHPHTIGGMISLASLYLAVERVQEAEELYTEALVIGEREFGRNGEHAINSLCGLGAVRHVQGRYEEAERLLTEGLDRRVQTLGEDHPEVAFSNHQIARLYRDTGRFDEARECFENAQRIWEAKLGGHHARVAENLTEWAALERRTGDEGGAQQMEARAGKIRGE